MKEGTKPDQFWKLMSLTIKRSLMIQTQINSRISVVKAKIVIYTKCWDKFLGSLEKEAIGDNCQPIVELCGKIRAIPEKIKNFVIADYSHQV